MLLLGIRAASSWEQRGSGLRSWMAWWVSLSNLMALPAFVSAAHQVFSTLSPAALPTLTSLVSLHFLLLLFFVVEFIGVILVHKII